MTTTYSYVLHQAPTYEEMLRFAAWAWGELGIRVVNKWRDFNERYFDEALRPTPIIITSTLPHGKRLADCIGAADDLSGRRLIRLNVPKHGQTLVATNGVLLHEMIHQFCFERGLDADHAAQPWRDQIMRLHTQITGSTIWAGRSRTYRHKKADGGGVYRMNEPGPNGERSLPQADIARWPESVGIDLGPLGS